MSNLYDDYRLRVIQFSHLLNTKPVFTAKDVMDLLREHYSNTVWTGKVYCAGSDLNRENLEENFSSGGYPYSDKIIEPFSDDIINQNKRAQDYELFYKTADDEESFITFNISNYTFFRLGSDGQTIRHNLTSKWQKMLIDRYQEKAANPIKTFNDICIEDLMRSINHIGEQVRTLNKDKDVLMAEMEDLLKRNINIDKSIYGLKDEEAEQEKGE